MIDSKKLPKRLVNLTAIQNKYRLDNHRFVINPAGRRSRKTLIGKRKVLLAALRNPGYKYFHGAPTHKQAKDIFWQDLKNETRLFRITKSETELVVRLLNGAEIHVIGLDKPERIEGQVWHGCHITEFGNIKDGAWEENIRPILSDTKGFALLDGVPEGRNFYYDLALYSCGGAIPKTQPILGGYAENPEDYEWAYFHWFSSDVLDEAEIQSAKNHLDERTYRQEYEGSFESYQGLAYQFGQHNLSTCEYDQNEIVSIGMDFNVNPMTATLNHIRGDELFQFGEIYLINSNTFEMRDTILEKYKPQQVIIYPDSTGKSEESNATESDLAILKKAGFTVRARSTNPRVKDRVNAMNSMLLSTDKTVRYHINAKNCPKTVNDFNKVERLDDGRLNKKQEDEGLKHITDAAGYLVAYNWPVKQRGGLIQRVT